MCITKESLITASNRINQTSLKLMQTYSACAKIVYIIVEGIDDVSYYQSILTNRIPRQWKTQIVVAKCRKNVVQTYKTADWKSFKKERVLFFIDRDLSDFTGEETPLDQNIYMTDKYSIENDLFCAETMELTLKTFYGLHDIDDIETEILLRLYQESYTAFETCMTIIMTQVLKWRLENYSVCLNNILIKNIISISFGKLSLKDITPYQTIEEYINAKCNMTWDITSDAKYMELFVQNNGPKRFIRGKYIRCFFIMFINSICESCSQILPSKTTVRPRITLGESNAIAQLAGIIRAPQLLEDFIGVVAKKLEAS